MGHTKGPWKKHPYSGNLGTLISFGDCSKGENVAAVMAQRDPVEGKANASLIAASPELLEDAKSTDQGYDWFHDRLTDFRLYHGAWSMDESEAWANSLLAHIKSRQIGTKAAIAQAEAKS